MGVIDLGETIDLEVNMVDVGIPHSSPRVAGAVVAIATGVENSTVFPNTPFTMPSCGDDTAYLDWA